MRRAQIAAMKAQYLNVSMRRLVWGLLLGAITVGFFACGYTEKMIPLDASAYKDDLASLSKVRIFFGHQSVGRDLLKGVSDFSRIVKSPLRIVRIEGAGADDLPGLFHVDIGKNKEPIGKIEQFERLLQRPGQVPYDVALLKFCYDDLSRDGLHDPHALVEEYAKRVAAIRAAQPRLRLIHVTIPLRADPTGWKTPIKRLLNRPTEEDADNLLRNKFNSELRTRFAGEALFDIAEVESTLPQGRRSSFMRGSDHVYTLAQAYSHDGGHLNENGRQHVAAAFIRVVAVALSKGG